MVQRVLERLPARAILAIAERLQCQCVMGNVYFSRCSRGPDLAASVRIATEGTQGGRELRRGCGRTWEATGQPELLFRLQEPDEIKCRIGQWPRCREPSPITSGSIRETSSPRSSAMVSASMAAFSSVQLLAHQSYRRHTRDSEAARMSAPETVLCRPVDMSPNCPVWIVWWGRWCLPHWLLRSCTSARTESAACWPGST
jgi:hypothetical protein